MATYFQTDANGFPLYLGGNRHTPALSNRLVGKSLIEAIELGMREMLKEKAVGNAAGWRIISAITRYDETAFPPATVSCHWGNLSNPNRSIGGGVVTTVETCGMPLVNGSTSPNKTVCLYFAGARDDVPGGEYAHELRA
jgi:hypothetical protein